MPITRIQQLRLTATGAPATGQSKKSEVYTQALMDGYITDYEISLGGNTNVGVTLTVNGEQIVPSEGVARAARARELNGTVRKLVHEGDYIVLWAQNDSLTDEVIDASITIEAFPHNATADEVVDAGIGLGYDTHLRHKRFEDQG